MKVWSLDAVGKTRLRRGLLHATRILVLLGTVNALTMRASEQAGSDEAQLLSHAAFDTVSIHPDQPGANGAEHIYPLARSGSFRAANVPMKSLMEFAYDLPDLRMIGGPEWLATAKYSLDARSDPKIDQLLANLPPDEAKQIKRKMLATVLEDRFKLTVHRESREMAVYALVIAKDGPKLESKPDSEPLPAGEDRIETGPGRDSLGILTYELSWRLGRPVLDRTGLQVREALKLHWQRDDVPSDSNAPSLFTAIQEQLGLKLESSRGSVPVLVIDHAERPTPN